MIDRRQRASGSRVVRTAWGLAVLLLAAGCNVDGPRPETPWQEAQKQAFQRDRDLCRSVAERKIPYVNPNKDGAVAARSQRVEAETQGCMLARGWNNPEFDGWKDGRQ